MSIKWNEFKRNEIKKAKYGLRRLEPITCTPVSTYRDIYNVKERIETRELETSGVSNGKEKYTRDREVCISHTGDPSVDRRIQSITIYTRNIKTELWAQGNIKQHLTEIYNCLLRCDVIYSGNGCQVYGSRDTIGTAQPPVSSQFYFNSCPRSVY